MRFFSLAVCYGCETLRAAAHARTNQLPLADHSMSDHSMSDGIASLLDSRRPCFALPGAFFSYPRVYAADLEHIFARHWLFLASEPEIPEAGDYRTYQIGPYPIFILRQDDGSLAAFHNTCRHRG